MSGNSKKREAELSNENATFGRGKDERIASSDPTETPAFGFPAVLADAISSAMNPTVEAAASVPAGASTGETPLSNAGSFSADEAPLREPLPDFGSASVSSAAANTATDSSGALTNDGAFADAPRPKKRGLFDRLAKNSKFSRGSASHEASSESFAADSSESLRSASTGSNGKNGGKSSNKQASGKAAGNGGNGAGQQGKAKAGKQGGSAQGGQGAPAKQGGQPNQGAKGSKTNNVDFLWEAEERHSAKGDPNATTVVESDNDYLLLPHPDVFNAYPPEVQRKIMQWADRDVRARRDDESLRQDALVRARTARERTHVTVPVTIIVLCIICATITGCVTRSAIFPVSFLVVALAVIISIYFTRKNDLYAFSQHPDNEDEDE